MTKLVVLDTIAHRHLRVHGNASAAFGDNRRFVGVFVREFPILAVQYPILFSKDAETGAFYTGVMLGFDEHENLFLDERKGQQGYRPLAMQRGPFFTSTDGSLVIDLDDPRVTKEGGEALFTETGARTPYLESIITLLGELAGGLEMSRLFVDRMLQLKLIEPVQIKVSFDDGQKLDLEGLYTIDQEALRALPDDVVIDLFRRGYLNLIYMMVTSIKQIALLAQRKNDRLLEPTAGLSAY